MTKLIYLTPVVDHSLTEVMISTSGIIITLETPTLGRIKRKSKLSTEELHLCLLFRNYHHAVP